MDDFIIRKIIRAGMDAFFAAAEHCDEALLRGRPVAAGRAAARSGVAATSYKARQFGVRCALPSAPALLRCPELVFVPPRFEVDRQVSRQVRAVFARYDDLIEPLSPGGASLDVTADKCGLETAWRPANAIRPGILENTCLTASASVSYNEFLAKVAPDHPKPNGQFTVTPDMGATWVDTLPVSCFHGIGPMTTAKMTRLCFKIGGNLRAKSFAFFGRHFGSSASWYFAIACGEDYPPVSPNRVRGSSGFETTFDRDLTDPDEIEGGVAKMAEDVWRWCEASQIFGRTIRMKIKYGDFQRITRSRNQGEPVMTKELPLRPAKDLVRPVLPPAEGITRGRIMVPNPGEPSPAQATALPMFIAEQAA